MCIGVFVWQAHPIHSLLLLLNRDEYHDRRTERLGWWDGGEILGGRDAEAGGTWLACSRDGRLAFVTNVREIPPPSDPKRRSRGDLVLRFLKSDKSPMEFGREVAEEGGEYAGFNLVLAHLPSKAMVFVSNRSAEPAPVRVRPGVHVLSNATLDSPWGKAVRLRAAFERSVAGEVAMEEMVGTLMTDTARDDDERSLPVPRVYSVEREFLLSSVFVERSPTPQGLYGTRSTSALSVAKRDGHVRFYERCWDDALSNDDRTVTFLIESRQ